MNLIVNKFNFVFVLFWFVFNRKVWIQYKIVTEYYNDVWKYSTQFLCNSKRLILKLISQIDLLSIKLRHNLSWQTVNNITATCTMLLSASSKSSDKFEYLMTNILCCVWSILMLSILSSIQMNNTMDWFYTRSHGWFKF